MTKWSVGKYHMWSDRKTNNKCPEVDIKPCMECRTREVLFCKTKNPIVKSFSLQKVAIKIF